MLHSVVFKCVRIVKITLEFIEYHTILRPDFQYIFGKIFHYSLLLLLLQGYKHVHKIFKQTLT